LGARNGGVVASGVIASAVVPTDKAAMREEGDMPASKNGRGLEHGETVQSISRALSVIKCFGEGTIDGLSLSEVAELTDLAPATARRILRTLQEHGYVEVRGRNYRLTTKILELGHAFVASLRFVDLCLPKMHELVAELQESVSVSVLDGEDILYIARVPKRRLLTMTISVGTRLPAHATSMGRVLLANLSEDELSAFLRETTFRRYTLGTVVEKKQFQRELSRVREQGWALVDQELELGVRSIAAPIVRGNGEVIAAMSVVSHPDRTDIDDMVTTFLPALQEAARRVSEDLANVERLAATGLDPRME
jgi:IclR family pca regulon transcriptional regulator